MNSMLRKIHFKMLLRADREGFMLPTAIAIDLWLWKKSRA